MSDKKELLQSMLNNLINDNTTEATVDSHNYFSQKMKEIMGGKEVPVAATTVEPVVAVVEPVVVDNTTE